MKSIFILTSEGKNGKGGISRVSDYFCREVNEGEYYYPLESITSTNGIPFPIWGFYFAYSLVRYFILAFRGKVALLHIHFASRGDTYRNLFFFYISVMFCIPVVMHHHGSGFKDFYNGLGNNLKNSVGKMLRLSKKVIILGELWRDFFVNEVGVDEEKIVVLPNAIPDKGIGKKCLSTDCLKFVFMGKLCEEKGIPTLITAFSKVTECNWSLTLAGNGKINEYKALAERLGVLDKVKFTGWVGEEEVDEILKISDAFILPSRQEIHPIAMLEAMAHKLAILTTPVGIIPEFCVHEENCLLFPVDDAEALARELKEFIERPLHVRRLGDAAYKTFIEKFEIKAYKKKMLEVYDDVLGFI